MDSTNFLDTLGGIISKHQKYTNIKITYKRISLKFFKIKLQEINS